MSNICYERLSTFCPLYIEEFVCYVLLTHPPIHSHAHSLLYLSLNSQIRKMNWGKPTILMAVCISLFFPLSIQSDSTDFLSPLLSPIFNNICDRVGCGEGSCNASSDSMFGYECQCKPGWMQFHFSDSLKFLPCVIPNCTINYSCFNQSIAPAPSPSSDRNFSLFDPCTWAYCGGGKCKETSNSVDHKCECDDGYSNLLNITSFPCYKTCSLGANCADLGLTVSNSSASPPSPNNLSDQNGSSNTRSFVASSLSALLLMISLAFH
ncbi:hypothetical protein LUZ60_005591 [Juncus effusus]|nr:hypothetical protein LUZ60_005591 [Juncus effusus]